METLALITLNWSFRKLGEIMITSLIRYKVADTALTAVLALISSCNMKNPLLTESSAPFGAPEFDKIRNEHYLPAFEAGIAEAKAEIDAIVANQDEPTFENTIEAMEYSGQKLSKVASIFYALMEANTNEQMQEIAEIISPIPNTIIVITYYFPIQVDICPHFIFFNCNVAIRVIVNTIHPIEPSPQPS